MEKYFKLKLEIVSVLERQVDNKLDEKFNKAEISKPNIKPTDKSFAGIYFFSS